MVEPVRRDDEWNLIINDVRYEDEGVYQCQVNTKDDQSNFYNIYLHIKSQCILVLCIGHLANVLQRTYKN